MNLTQALKICLIKKGLSQVEVGKRIGLTRSAISRSVVDGDSISVKNLTRLADAMGYSVRIQLVDKETGEVIEA